MNSNKINQRTIIKRELKIDESNKDVKDFREVEDYLKTISMKFMNAPVSIENLDKAYKDMTGVNSKDKTEKGFEGNRSKSRKHEEKSIFYDIFIKPKENKIKEIRMKRNELKGISDINVNDLTKAIEKPRIFISNKTSEIEKPQINLSSSKHIKVPSIVTINTPTPTSTQHVNITTSEAIIKNLRLSTVDINPPMTGLDLIKNNLVMYFKENSDEKSLILFDFLWSKFVPKDVISASKKNFFNQLIQIRPPEGINASAASPLIDSNKGWAPSIPSLQVSKMKTNLSDLLMRAKGGIQAGDIPKEAHMAFYLGILNEEEKKYEEALKFYKKFFLSAKLLQDVYGTELALNRIAVLYSNILDYNQSLYYNEKHKDITTHNVNGFVAFYNCGITQRTLGKIEESLRSFNRALQMAEEENDLESYTLCLCQHAISFLFCGNLNSYFEYAEEFFNKNKTLRHSEMELEMQLINGYVNNFCNNLDVAKEAYMHSLKQSTHLSLEYYKALSLCNIGIIEGSKDLDEFIDSLN